MHSTSPWITEELGIFQEQVARFLEREFVPHAADWERAGRVDREAWLKAGAAGLLCASIPERYGGGGGTYAHEAVIHQEVYRAGLGGGFGAGNSVSSAIVAHYVLAYGTEHQKQTWLPRMATGELIGAVAMTEPGAGSDLQGISTRAKQVDNGYIVTGQKTFITNGQNADLILVVAKTDVAAGSKGVSILAVEASSAEGFQRGRNLEKFGMHAQDTSELFFNDVFVPHENLLGTEPGHGFVQLMQQLAWERLTIAIASAVSIERALDQTISYVKERSAFGKRLIDFQNTQFVLADCKAKALVARTLVDQLMVRLLAGELDGDTAAAARLWVTETQAQVVDASCSYTAATAT